MGQRQAADAALLLVEQVKEVRVGIPRPAAAAAAEAMLAPAALERAAAALLGVLMTAAATEKDGCVCGAGGSCLGAAV